MSAADVAHLILRAGVFERGQLFRELYAEKGFAYTAADVRRVAHQFKAWKSLRLRLDAKRAAQLVAKVPGVNTETVLKFFEVLQLLPADAWPGSSRFETAWDWESWLRQNGLDIPPDLLDALLAAIGDLTAEFLAQLEGLGKFELPAPTITITQQGQLPAGAEVLDVGRTVSVELVVPAGASRSRVSRSQVGPMVLERVAVLVDVAAAVDVQVKAVPSGVSVASTATPEQVAGIALFEATDANGAQQPFVSMTPFGLSLEMWPRKAIALGSVGFVFTARNNSGVQRSLVALLDGRDVRLTA